MAKTRSTAKKSSAKKSIAKKSIAKKSSTKKAAAKNAAKKKTAAKQSLKKSAKKASARPAVKRSRESQAARRARAEAILAALRATYPEADCALRHGSAYELLVAVILSAQCTDERVNMVTPELFERCPSPAELATIEPAELETLIRSTGFYRNKAKNLTGMAQQVMADHGGEIPDTMEALLALPGVARKTANCVLGTWFGKHEGIVVDTHVGRLALRLRLLTSARDDKDAVKIEQDLLPLFEQFSWTYLSHALISHGREICQARRPKCADCGLAEMCPSAGQAG